MKIFWQNNNLMSAISAEFGGVHHLTAQLEVEKAETEKTLANVSPGNYSQVQKLYNQVEKLKQAIDVATERWLELAEMES